MRTALLCQLGTTALLAAAQPGLHRRHADFHKRHSVTVTEIETEVETIRFIIEGGVTVSTETIRPTPAPKPSSAPEPSAAPEPAVSQEKDAVNDPAEPEPVEAQPSPVEAPPAPPSTPASPPAYAPEDNTPDDSGDQPTEASPGNSGGSSGLGIAYSPYTNDNVPGATDPGCRNVQADAQKLVSDGYDYIRIYSVGDCKMLQIFSDAIDSANSKTKIIVSPTGKTKDAELANRAWSNYAKNIHSIIVTNEVVMTGQKEPDQIAQLMSAARGSGVKVSAAEAPHTYTQNPQIAANMDYCAVNIHAYQQSGGRCNGPSGASSVTDCITEKVNEVKKVCGSKPIIVTESGWPDSGQWGPPNQPPDPHVFSQGEQQSVIAALKTLPQNGIDIILFMAYDDNTKEGSCEKHLGFLDGVNPA